MMRSRGDDGWPWCVRSKASRSIYGADVFRRHKDTDVWEHQAFIIWWRFGWKVGLMITLSQVWGGRHFCDCQNQITGNAARLAPAGFEGICLGSWGQGLLCFHFVRKIDLWPHLFSRAHFRSWAVTPVDALHLTLMTFSCSPKGESRWKCIHMQWFLCLIRER